MSSEQVQILSTIIGLVVSIVAVVISILSLKQTQQSIEEANRPYVVVYKDYIQVLSTVHEYIVVKNFGNSGAVIDSLEFNPEFLVRDKNVFGNIGNSFIAPGQSISTAVSHNVFAGDRSGITEVTIKYHSGKKHFKEVIKLNEEIVKDFLFMKANPSSNKSLEEIITKATEEVLRRNL
ncbi:hypothetical protein ABW02_06855 [Niallia circulans]|uniref:Uncharacterized protein n=1 Tax=Niallia circulans TaxID=1397 RepID=A0A0J1INA3_NIACI|nr:hypothetical protein ABW02_06855 [Niallia circulans]